MQDLRTCFEEPYRDDDHPCPALETTSEQAQRIHGIAFSFTACRKNCEPKVPSSKLTAASMFKPQLQQSSRKAQHMTKKMGHSLPAACNHTAWSIYEDPQLAYGKIPIPGVVMFLMGLREKRRILGELYPENVHVYKEDCDKEVSTKEESVGRSSACNLLSAN